MNQSDKKRIEALLNAKIDHQVRETQQALPDPKLTDLPLTTQRRIYRVKKEVEDLAAEGILIVGSRYSRHSDIAVIITDDHPASQARSEQVTAISTAGEKLKEELVLALYGGDLDAQEIVEAFESKIKEMGGRG